MKGFITALVRVDRGNFSNTVLNTNEISSMTKQHDNYYNRTYVLITMKSGEVFDCPETLEALAARIREATQ